MHDHDGKHDHEHSHSHAHEHEHGSHAHTHEHSHSHTHSDAEHVHSEEELHSSENKDMQTLHVLLSHWIDHNKSHTEGFREWADKADKNGKTDTAGFIRKAVEAIDAANAALEDAKQTWNK